MGGTSVSTPDTVNSVIQIIKSSLKSDKVCVVVSAFGGVTDYLLETGKLAEKGNEKYKANIEELEKRHIEAVKSLIQVRKQSRVLANVKFLLNELEEILHGVFLVKEMTAKTQDYILSFGERLSAYIITESLNNKGIISEYIDSRELIKTDNDFGRANVNSKSTYRRIKKHFKKNKKLQVVPGFIGSTDKKETTTIGRGGSDYTAALLAAALKADVLEIWTDVDGVMTIDPRKVQKAFPVPRLSYNEAMELSHFGAKVIYPPTIQPVLSKGIPIQIKNTFNPSAPGSFIGKSTDGNGLLIKGISSIDNIALLTLQGSGMIGVAGISMRLFRALARKKINVVLISQASSEHSISFAIAPEDSQIAKKVVEKEFELEIKNKRVDEVKIEKNLSIVAIVGENMRMTRGIAGKLFSALGKNGINVVAIAQGSSELNISIVIENRELRKALNVIHDSFFLSETMDLNLFLVGIGTIGSTLLQQINQQLDYLLKTYRIKLNLTGLANSKKMLFNEKGISTKTSPRTLLQQKGEPSNIGEFAKRMIEMNLPNSIFIDCTADNNIPDLYEKILGVQHFGSNPEQDCLFRKIGYI